MTLTQWLGTFSGFGRQCGYTEKDRATIGLLRKTMLGVLLVLLVLMGAVALHPLGAVALVLAGLLGVCFVSVLFLSWQIALLMRDEYGRELMRRSLMLGLGITLGAVSVCGFLESATDGRWHVPLLAVPVFLILVTAVAKVMVFRRAKE